VVGAGGPKTGIPRVVSRPVGSEQDALVGRRPLDPYQAPIARRRAARQWQWWVGAALMLPLAILPFVAFVSLYGDSFPISRIGVASTSAGGLRVVSVVCPSERLRAVRVTKRVPPSEVDRHAARNVTIWSLHGDAPLPASMEVGTAPPGMVELADRVGYLQPDDRISVTVVTSESQYPYQLDFVVRDVPPHGVWSDAGPTASEREFRRDTLRKAPCGDPDRRRQRAGRFVGYWFGFAAVCSVPGIVLVNTARERRRRDS